MVLDSANLFNRSFVHLVIFVIIAQRMIERIVIFSYRIYKVVFFEYNYLVVVITFFIS